MTDSTDTDENAGESDPADGPATDGAAAPDAETPPPIRDYEGVWDEALSGIVVAAPFILLLLGAAAVVALTVAGAIRFDVRVGGSVDVMALLRPLALPVAVGLAATYLLFLMKFFGARPVTFILDLLDGYERR